MTGGAGKRECREYFTTGKFKEKWGRRVGQGKVLRKLEILESDGSFMESGGFGGGFGRLCALGWRWKGGWEVVV